jgi:RNA polymerase sigma-B factor
MDDERVKALIRRHRHDGDRAARNEIIEAHRALARGLARRFARRGEPLDDLEQVALVGVLKAIERFDPHAGTPFAGFAAATVIGELKRHLRDRTWRVRVPRRAQERSLEIGRAVESLGHRLHRAPTMAEIADVLGCSIDDVLEAMEVAASYHNVNPDLGTGDFSIGGLSRRASTTEPGFAALEDADLVRDLLARLPERERTICELRFFDDLTQREIAGRVGISQMHVSRLLRASLDRMRDHLATTDA